MTKIEMIVTIVCAIIGSTGFWAFISRFLEKKSARTELLVGLGHDRIIALCETYIDRGYITSDEYDNLFNYLYKPYAKNGGNGSAERAIKIVEKLPVRRKDDHYDTLQ